MRPPEHWVDSTYPDDPDEAAAEAMNYWLANQRPWEAAAFAALVARRVAEIARFGLKHQRRG